MVYEGTDPRKVGYDFYEGTEPRKVCCGLFKG